MAYVYRHIRLDKNEPFYIGIGSDVNYNRAYEIKKNRRNIVWSRITSKSKIEVEIMLDGLTWFEACEKEIEFIKLYGRLDLGNGILANLTDGGDGTLGVIVSKETRKKSSERFSGKNNPMYGKKNSQESIERGRLKRLGQPAWNKGKTGIYSDSQLKKMSEIKKGKIPWNKGVTHTEETRRKISAIRISKNLIPWNLGKKGVNGITQAKVVLNLDNGVFYESCKEASLFYNIPYSTLKCKLNGAMKNNTNLIYA
jgi:hypothetical protein